MARLIHKTLHTKPEDDAIDFGTVTTSVVDIDALASYYADPDYRVRMFETAADDKNEGAKSAANSDLLG